MIIQNVLRSIKIIFRYPLLSCAVFGLLLAIAELSMKLIQTMESQSSVLVQALPMMLYTDPALSSTQKSVQAQYFQQNTQIRAQWVSSKDAFDWLSQQSANIADLPSTVSKVIPSHWLIEFLQPLPLNQINSFIQSWEQLAQITSMTPLKFNTIVKNKEQTVALLWLLFLGLSLVIIKLIISFANRCFQSKHQEIQLLKMIGTTDIALQLQLLKVTLLYVLIAGYFCWLFCWLTVDVLNAYFLPQLFGLSISFHHTALLHLFNILLYVAILTVVLIWPISHLWVTRIESNLYKDMDF